MVEGHPVYVAISLFGSWNSTTPIDQMHVWCNNINIKVSVWWQDVLNGLQPTAELIMLARDVVALDVEGATVTEQTTSGESGVEPTWPRHKNVRDDRASKS